MPLNHLETRNSVVEDIKKAFIGPVFDQDEVLEFSPLELYMSGILYPQDNNSNLDFSSEDDTNITNEKVTNDKYLKEETDDSEELTLASSFKPSAMGLSFVISKNQLLNININYAFYNKNVNQIDKSVTYSSNSKNTTITLNVNNSIQWSYLGVNGDNGNPHFTITIEESNDKPKLILAVTVREYLDNKVILTLSLVNSQVKGQNNTNGNKKSYYDAEQCFFRNEIIVESSDKSPIFLKFDDMSNLGGLSDEELNLKLLYRDYNIYASGHGCSVSWNDLNKPGESAKKKIFTEVIPQYSVDGINFEPEELIQKDINGNITKDCEVLYMKRLSGEGFRNNLEPLISKNQIIYELNEFVSEYQSWIIEQETHIGTLQVNELKNIAKKNIEKCESLHERMVKGIALLQNNDNAYEAFCDANKAMFMQRAMSGFIKERRLNISQDLFPGENHNDRNVNEELPDWKDFSFKGDQYFTAKWRPFQLAFFLSQIEGITDPSSKDRDTVDLIWFATGGGKTEAYLGLISFTIFYRRLRQENPDDGAGVTALMRYTLRLLNVQQFQRASSLIFACELIRREKEFKYGTIAISIGIWVGEVTPNKWFGRNYEQFHESYLKLVNNPDEVNVKYNLPISSCPCCGTKIIKTGGRTDQRGEWGVVKQGAHYYGLKCTNSECSFFVAPNADHSDKFPIHFVDEDIYNTRPSLLFSTIDKYASINWNDRSFELFNYDLVNKEYRNEPPELIIQDELHLINSAIGTIYGVYEIAIDELCSGKGNRPKIVAATATVRNAEKQCRQLYSRENFLQFPPSCIDADDSFYSRRMQCDNNARLYLGLQPSGHTNTTAQIRLISMLMQRIPMIESDNEVMDYYYTSLVYFNTLKELGKFRTLLSDDINSYRRFLAEKIYLGIYKKYNEFEIAELSSARTGKEINIFLDKIENERLPITPYSEATALLSNHGIRALSNIDLDENHFHQYEFPYLFNKHDAFNKLGLDYTYSLEDDKTAFITHLKNTIKDSNVLKLVASTNMISVGVDISRLNVMQITGQPKSHSEYIQASSRVGRTYPGLIITTFNPAKNRDRSHYEKFIHYHQAFYKDVESTSVTPYSEPALEKALAAVILALMRAYHYGSAAGPTFNQIDKDEFDKVVNKIKLRSQQSNPNQPELLNNNIDAISEKIKLIWAQQFDVLDGNIRFSSYPDYANRGNLGDLQTQNISNSLYIDPSYANIWPFKLKCMTSLRNVEFHSLIDIKK